jgi:hypothetical protein
MGQGRHPAERVQGEIRGRDVRGERVHLDPDVGYTFLGQGQPGDADVDAIAVTVQDERHAAILAFR